MTSNQRADFERWLRDVHMLDATWDEPRNCYKEFLAHLAFQAWQAARAAPDVAAPLTRQQVHLAMMEGIDAATKAWNKAWKRAETGVETPASPPQWIVEGQHLPADDFVSFLRASYEGVDGHKGCAQIARWAAEHIEWLKKQIPVPTPALPGVRDVMQLMTAASAPPHCSTCACTADPRDERCPHCSFQPTSLSDYCDKHRPELSENAQ